VILASLNPSSLPDNLKKSPAARSVGITDAHGNYCGTPYSRGKVRGNQAREEEAGEAEEAKSAHKN